MCVQIGDQKGHKQLLGSCLDVQGDFVVTVDASLRDESCQEEVAGQMSDPSKSRRPFPAG